jgi:hypothetical protein
MNPTPPPPPSDYSECYFDSRDSPIIFFDCTVDYPWRPMRRDIPGMPPDALDLPPTLEKRKEPEEGPKDEG